MPRPAEPAADSSSLPPALQALDAAVRGISGVLDIEQVLQLIVDRVRELVGAQYAALGIVDEAGLITQFITSGISSEQRGAIGDLPRGHGLLGLIIRENRSYRIPTIASHPESYGFPPNHPPMESFLGVPVTVKGEVVGRLYLTNKQGAPEFSAGDQALVETFALHAGIAIENARLHGQVQRLAIFDERDRISRDLHDSVIQSIYAVTLSLDDVPELVDEAPGEARQRVDDAIDALHGVIRDIRNFIFGLRPLLLDSGSLLDGLRALADELRRNTTTEIDMVGEESDGVSLEVVAELLAIAREALANVARHSGAKHAWMRVTTPGESVRLEIEDDGRGIHLGAAPARGHHGLHNMRARAVALGGTFDIESGQGEGTRIIAVIPRTGTRRGSRQ
jgi:signal transduction histidine kinase